MSRVRPGKNLVPPRGGQMRDDVSTLRDDIPDHARTPKRVRVPTATPEVSRGLLRKYLDSRPGVLLKRSAHRSSTRTAQLPLVDHGPAHTRPTTAAARPAVPGDARRARAARRGPGAVHGDASVPSRPVHAAAAGSLAGRRARRGTSARCRAAQSWGPCRSSVTRRAASRSSASWWPPLTSAPAEPRADGGEVLLGDGRSCVDAVAGVRHPDGAWTPDAVDLGGLGRRTERQERPVDVEEEQWAGPTA